MRKMIALLLALASAIFLPLVADDGSKEDDKIVEISIVKYKFVPETVTITPGTTVRWINKEKRQYHSVWFEESGGEESDCMFPGDTLEMTFDETGKLPYRCGPHPEMTGTIIVSKGDG